MLKVDLGLLKREGRLEIEAELPADDRMWEGTGIELGRPLSVRFELRAVGDDVLVHGRIRGEIEMECRRCLVPVTAGVDEEVSWLYRAGISAPEAEEQEVYALPAKASWIDLAEPVREHMLLSIPRFAICRAACRGLCAICGANLNETTCDCGGPEPDERWAPLRGLKTD